MKKSLEHIFDEANAKEIERLVDQNAAPDVSADTLDSIKNKVYAKTGIAKRKKKKSFVFRWQSYVTAACLFLAFGIMLGTGILPLPVAYAAEADYEDVKLLNTYWEYNWSFVDPSNEPAFSWNVDLSKNPDELLMELEGQDVVIQKDDVVIQGRELWDDFYTKTQNGESTKIKIAYYSTNQDAPEMLLRLISFDGYLYRQDTVQSLNPDYREIRLFRYLDKFEGICERLYYSEQPYWYADYVLSVYGYRPIEIEAYCPEINHIPPSLGAWWNAASMVCKFR